MVSLLFTAFAVLAVIVNMALVLVFIDAARNVRAIRQSEQRDR